MNKKKVVIIGGVAGGATTATRLRRLDETTEIIIIEKGDYISYANCGLPYYIGDVIKERASLLVQTPTVMKEHFNIDVRTGNEVLSIDRINQTIRIRQNSTDTEYEESYDKLVISTGSTPLVPPIPGINSPQIFTLWNIPDTDKIKKYILENKPKRAAVIGGGFIGLEMAENLHSAGCQVSIIEMQDQVMSPVDFEIAQLIHENIIINKVKLILSDGVKDFETINNTVKINLFSGKSLDADIVILSIGIRPNSALAKAANLQLNERGAILVDEYLKTSDSNIYAVGDVIEVTEFIEKEKTMVPLAGPANKQARICAGNIYNELNELNEKESYNGTQGTSVAKVFDLTIASTGLNEKSLIRMGKKINKDFYVALINQKSHAGYYPGATTITLKMLFSKTGKIFGAQIVGQNGVDKRIDVIATAIRLQATVKDLEKLELAYAPPYSSAKDPVNMLGFVANNILSGLVCFIPWNGLENLAETANYYGTENITILDVSEDAERMAFAIVNSIHIPFGQIRERIKELNKDSLIITYCAIGVRSYNVARILSDSGFNNVVVYPGGSAFYKSVFHDTLYPATERYRLNNLSENIINKPDLKTIHVTLDCNGLQCPGPIMKVFNTINEIQEGQIIKVLASDIGFARDIDAWCKRTGNTLLKTERENSMNIVYIQKGQFSNTNISNYNSRSVVQSPTVELPQGKTMIVFSGDLDKVLASFIIANGAASMGMPVTMFFTFWGLNALRKTSKIYVKKPFLDKMFGIMMPRGTSKLRLSNINIGGIGTKMMKKVMKDKNVDSLEALMKNAMSNGVKLVACTMSMDVMGITKEELIEGIEYAGVATYLGDAENSNVNLFI